MRTTRRQHRATAVSESPQGTDTAWQYAVSLEQIYAGDGERNANDGYSFAAQEQAEAAAISAAEVAFCQYEEGLEDSFTDAQHVLNNVEDIPEAAPPNRSGSRA